MFFVVVIMCRAIGDDHPQTKVQHLYSKYVQGYINLITDAQIDATQVCVWRGKGQRKSRERANRKERKESCVWLGEGGGVNTCTPCGFVHTLHICTHAHLGDSAWPW